MAPLITLLVVTLLLRGAGFAGIRALQSWHTSVRGGLAAMFTLTGTAHFNGTRAELVAMVPPAVPHAELLVTLTGVLELLGAAGMLHRRTAPWAAGGLALLLVAMFPANVYASLAGLTVNGSTAMALLPRTLIQLVFITATVLVVLPYIKALPRRRSEPVSAAAASGKGSTPPTSATTITGT